MRPITRLEVLQALERGGITLELLIERGKAFMQSQDERIAESAWEKLLDLVTGGKKSGPIVAVNVDMRDAVGESLKQIREKAKGNIVEIGSGDG